MYAYEVAVPVTMWFPYQAWLTQRGRLPITHYTARIGEFPYTHMIIAFLSVDDYDAFRRRWRDTL